MVERAAPLRLVPLAELKQPKIPALELCQQIFESRPARWEADPEHGVVPEVEISNYSGGPVRGQHFFLQTPLRDAKMDGLHR